MNAQATRTHFPLLLQRIRRYRGEVSHMVGQLAERIERVRQRRRTNRLIASARRQCERVDFALAHMRVTGCEWKTAWRRANSLFFRDAPL